MENPEKSILRFTCNDHNHDRSGFVSLSKEDYIHHTEELKHSTDLYMYFCKGCNVKNSSVLNHRVKFDHPHEVNKGEAKRIYYLLKEYDFEYCYHCILNGNAIPVPDIKEPAI